MPHLPGLPLMLAVPGREGLINWLGSSNREMAVAQAEWRRGLHPALMHGTGEAMMQAQSEIQVHHHLSVFGFGLGFYS